MRFTGRECLNTFKKALAVTCGYSISEIRLFYIVSLCPRTRLNLKAKNFDVSSDGSVVVSQPVA